MSKAEEPVEPKAEEKPAVEPSTGCFACGPGPAQEPETIKPEKAEEKPACCVCCGAAPAKPIEVVEVKPEAKPEPTNCCGGTAPKPDEAEVDEEPKPVETAGCFSACSCDDCHILPKYVERPKESKGKKVGGKFFAKAWNTITNEYYTIPHNKGQYKGTFGKKGDGCCEQYLGNFDPTIEWVADGKGVAIWTEGPFRGSRYEGDFVLNKMHGKGKFTWSNGTVFEGNFEHDKSKDGIATLKFKRGEKYVGDWKNGARTGKGVYTWTNGDTYEGDWVQNKRTGKGTFKSSDGNTVYVGDWKDGRKEGQGVLTLKDSGEEYKGLFRHDIYIDPNTVGCFGTAQ